MRPRSGGICDVFPGGSEYSGHREKRLFCPGLNLINDIMTTNITSARQIPKPACAYRVQHAGSEHCKRRAVRGLLLDRREPGMQDVAPVPCEMARSGSRTVLFRAFFSLKKENTPRRTARRPVRDKRKKRVFSAQRQLEKALSGRLRG